jgi:hypothetical protein
MVAQRDQCPFVNQADARCAQRLSLERLDYAFAFCFDEYDCCPVYLDRLLEHRLRHIRSGVITGNASDGTTNAHGPALVQLTTPKTTRSAPAA